MGKESLKLPVVSWYGPRSYKTPRKVTEVHNFARGHTLEYAD